MSSEHASMVGRQLGVYRIQSLIGAGGMGEVYLARDTRLGRDVALKFLPRAFTNDAERLARFEREARVLASLNHPNIGAIYDIQDAEGIRALVLELIDGETLAERVARAGGKGEPSRLSVAETLVIARQIAEALDVAHEKGIVHRDLKPANVKIASTGLVKVLDFGLARFDAGSAASAGSTHAATAASDGTHEGLIVGTVSYMSPEQARGQAIDKRTDIWAFGCVLYEMLTGRGPFARDTMSDTLAAILQDTPDWSRLPVDTPPGLRRLLERCLEKNQRLRLRDIGDVHLELDDAPAARPPAIPIAPARPGDRFKWPFAIVSLVALAEAILAIRPFATDTGGMPEFSRVTQITQGASSEFSPAISPDGKWIAYLSNARGPTDVWVRFLGGSDPINLTATTTLNITSRSDLGGLAISPDGSSIAFDAGATPTTPAPEFDAWVLPAPLGGQPRKAVALGRALRWSPDGTQILFVRPGSSAGDSLFVAKSDGGSPIEVVPLRGGIHIHWPTWSQDGRYIYFNYSLSSANREPSEIYRVAATGGPIEPAVQTARRAAFPLPMPDGRGLIYSANPTSVDLALWWRASEGSEPRRLTTGVGEYAETSITADGRSMISTLIQFQQALTSYSIGAAPTPQPRHITDGTTGDFDPVFAPGGNQLVFSSSRSGFRNLWIASPDATKARALTSGNAFDERPAFSPDGQRIAFVSDRGGQRGIWVMNADGGIPEQVLQTPVVDGLVWSPDGRSIVYAMAAGDMAALHLLNLADRTARKLETPGPAVYPFSFVNDTIGYLEPFPGGVGTPNVNRVSFVRTSGEPVPVDALRSLNLANGFAAISSDGRRLAAVVDPGGTAGSIWISDLTAGTPFQKVTDLPGSVRPRGAAWTPAGDALIVGTIQRTSHLVLFDQAK